MDHFLTYTHLPWLSYVFLGIQVKLDHQIDTNKKLIMVLTGDLFHVLSMKLDPHNGAVILQKWKRKALDTERVVFLP